MNKALIVITAAAGLLASRPALSGPWQATHVVPTVAVAAQPVSHSTPHGVRTATIPPAGGRVLRAPVSTTLSAVPQPWTLALCARVSRMSDHAHPGCGTREAAAFPLERTAWALGTFSVSDSEASLPSPPPKPGTFWQFNVESDPGPWGVSPSVAILLRWH